MVNQNTDPLVGQLGKVKTGTDIIYNKTNDTIAAMNSLFNGNFGTNLIDKLQEIINKFKEFYDLYTEAFSDSFNVTNSRGGGIHFYGAGGYTPVYAKGGIVSHKDSNALDPLARSLGEHHMVPVKEGEIILNKDQQEALLKSLNLVDYSSRTNPTGLVKRPATYRTSSSVAPVFTLNGNLVNVEGSVSNENLKTIQKQIDARMNQMFKVVQKGHI